MTSLRIGLPKGRIQQGVFQLLHDAGIEITTPARGYRPRISLPQTEAKLLKPQNIVEMLHIGSRDLGFAGADWVAELAADVIEVMDTRLDPVDLVAAAPPALVTRGALPARRLVLASEYERLARSWASRERLDAEVVRSYGATEAFPPDDADIIIDNSATGSTLEANGLTVIGVLMSSSTRVYASRQAWEDPARRERIEALRLVLQSVLEARRRVLVEVNTAQESLEAVVRVLPAMRQATVSPLFGESGYAVKAAVPRELLLQVIPALKAAGATDVVVSTLAQIVP